MMYQKLQWLPHLGTHHPGGEGGARDQAAWDDLFNKFIECGENWMNSELVTKSTSVREQSHTGTWALMSKKDSCLKHITDLVHCYALSKPLNRSITIKSYQVLDKNSLVNLSAAGFYFFPKDLKDKYGDDDAVSELIQRKTSLNQYEPDPNFPQREDCWFQNISYRMNTHNPSWC